MPWSIRIIDHWCRGEIWCHQLTARASGLRETQLQQTGQTTGARGLTVNGWIQQDSLIDIIISV